MIYGYSTISMSQTQRVVLLVQEKKANRAVESVGKQAIGKQSKKEVSQ